MIRLIIASILFTFSLNCADSDSKTASEIKIKQAPKIPENKVAAVQAQPASENPDGHESSSQAHAPRKDSVFMFQEDSIEQLMVVDYEMEMEPFSTPNVSLTDFWKSNTLIFYFSTNCGHCSVAAPHVLNLMKEIKSNDIKFLFIATSSSPPKKLSEFITNNKIDMPVVRDASAKFGRTYGTGYVPLIFLVNKKGNFIRFSNFKQETTPDLIKQAFSQEGMF